MAISEFIHAESCDLLRNPAVLRRPLPADEAVAVIQAASFAIDLSGLPAQKSAPEKLPWRRR